MQQQPNHTYKTMKKQPTYEEAVRRVETLVAQLENNELDIDTLSKRLVEAQQLLALCRDKLTRANEEIHKILDEN